jgi:broad specificity phosphatase PhoE
MIGQRLTGAHALWYMVLWFFDVKSASMHDGETYAAFVTRLALARKHLEELPADARVVIVSHSTFINFFIEHMRHPQRMNIIRAAVRFLHILSLKNTSITHVRYEKPTRGYTGTGWHRVWGK